METLEWLNTLSPSDFPRAEMAIGMFPGIADAASEVYRILVGHLNDGQTEEFLDGLVQFISSMRIGSSGRVVELILASLGQDVDQRELRRIELADSLAGPTLAEDDYPNFDDAPMGIEEPSDNAVCVFSLKSVTP